MKVKICGLNIARDVQLCINLKVNFLGFVFYKKSPRNINLKDLDKLRKFEKNKQFKNDFINYARKVYYTNDKRAILKNEINLKTNSIISEVKSYEKY